MKILYVITGADIGGAQKHLLYLSDCFKKKGHEVHVVLGEDGPLQHELLKQNIDVTIIPIPRTIVLRQDFKALKKLFLFIKNGKYDIVHSHSSKAGIIARLAGFLNRIDKNIFTAHGFVFTDPTLSAKKRTMYLWLEKLFSYFSTDIITVSAFDYHQGKANGINGRKMSIIHNGIPEKAIISSPVLTQKQQRLRQRDKKVIGFVGRFASEKNLDMLLRVAARFTGQNVAFWLIGDGPLYGHYQNVITRRNLEEIVLLKGHQDNVLGWMDNMDAMIITSHKEGLPFVLLEACGRGLPVISTDVGGVKEVVDPDGKKEILVAINDDEAMYEKLHSLLVNDSYREELGRYFLKVVGRFTVEQMCRETNEIYLAHRKGLRHHVSTHQKQSN
ncbi:glycosyltransferase family 1 protein [Neobacillus notoginsengisoli]|uniref:Glycosyltransferase family 1 protein n=1 Tax=Neobacillus notoginsengisoli TaxID=1578198 RepID=A0A417YYH4_9BACI|nr:glycosyltransferase family 4 protein [Neobacillus notoginsengisoli]RHW42764.1 glycosyltransferase family 1 protein [Neobacillus notoginsengisoli]